MNKEKLSAGNVVWYNENAWVIQSIHTNTVYAYKFGQPSVSVTIRFEDIQGIPITIDDVVRYLGINMEREVTDTTMPEEADWYDIDTHRIRLSSVWWKTNRGGEVPAWFCHLDNDCYDSVGHSADLLYINELQNFLNLFK